MYSRFKVAAERERPAGCRGGVLMTANKVQEGRINRLRTMDLIRTRPGVSRIEAAEALGLNRSTLTHIVNDLLESDLIREEAAAHTVSRGGRKPIGLKCEDFYVLGIEWQVPFIRISLNLLSGESVHREQINLESYSLKEVASEIRDLVPGVGEKILLQDMRSGHRAAGTDQSPYRGCS